MIRLSPYFIVIGIILVSSCVSNKRVILFQNLEENVPIGEGELITYEIPEYRLQFNDILDVQVFTVSEMNENGFGFKSGGGAMAQVGQLAQSGGDIYYITGYTVDKNGNIRLPLIGDLNVLQLTIDEARLVIEEKLRAYVKSEMYVKVKLGGIRFATLGEFRRPGKFVVLQERMTIFEAIAQAGDLTTVAKRDEIILIRQYPDGSKLHKINLNDRNIIKSPFYFIQPNDQLYAEPMRIREIGAGENAVQSLSLLISSITAIALVISLTK